MSFIDLGDQATLGFRFDQDLIPLNSEVDLNIGTSSTPFRPLGGRHRILVDPLFHICDGNAKLTTDVTAFCFAVSNYTGFSTFHEYNAEGMSSSLSKVTQGTSHESLKLKSKRTVLVLEAMVLFTAIHEKKSTIHRLKMDMQGYELAALSNIKVLLKDTNLVTHIMAECHCPDKEGRQVYQVENSCVKVSELLQEAGYETKWECDQVEWSDCFAYKRGVATDFLPNWQ